MFANLTIPAPPLPVGRAAVAVVCFKFHTQLVSRLIALTIYD